ncbi:LexA family transcriptional regulator [Hymenobacter rubripertinctus]|uniref:LexA family transcriptional regulator n=1 Tax=Hymenobacter rubripertinctus TaxID=2029981 RepID=A0A418R2U7_9BACT|nr:LexA family transcriptional regulator [Hymenobacter rubripertinctus]
MSHYGLSAYQLAKNLGYEGPQKLYKLVQNKSKPGYETLMDILENYPELRAEWLMRGEVPMIRAGHTSDAATEAGSYPGIPYAVTVNAQGEEQVSIVSTKAQAGYLIARDVEETLGELDTISVPGHHGKSVRAFEVAGDSMQPTISPGDLVIGSFTERLDLIQPKHIYVVVTHDRLMVKRLRGPVKKNEPIELLSDNRFYDPFFLPQKELKELWQVNALLTGSIPANTNETFDRMLVLLEMLAHDSQHLRSILLDVAARYDVKLVAE